MRRLQTIGSVSLLCLGLGCSSSPPPPPSVAPEIQVSANKETLEAMAGRWEGEYTSPSTGRSGTIVFVLTGKESTAYGDVLMKPKNATPKPGEDPLKSMPQILQIRFVDAEGGGIVGNLDPYEDPDCLCQVQTSFKGKRTGDVMEGQFTTTPQGVSAVKATGGTWRVSRVTKKVD